MGKYTIRLEEVCNYLYNEQDSVLNSKNFNTLSNGWQNDFNPDLPNPFGDTPDIDTIISKVRTKIFDFNYPKPNDNDDTKVDLETKIIKHYYMQEIGFETWGRFKLALNERLNLIMPYFNEMYKSVTLNSDNPLSNTDITEMKNTKNNITSDSDNTTNITGSNKQVYQDTPTSNLGNTDYATTITDVTGDNTTTSNSNSNSNGNEDMIRTITGLSNYSKQDMIRRYRENIINIEEAIVNELYDLFMLIY